MARSIAHRRADAVALPEWILPQLVDAAPDGDQWLHESPKPWPRSMRARR
jgi:hypothetical protein